jgi:hypothetical protein
LIKAARWFKELLPEQPDILKSLNSIIGKEQEASKFEVPGPNFIPQGVSSRRDMIL